ncbi:hypothetical protein M758_6G074300 [Ceratodon purpureus]|nr:hypothetical protein M758_6G074300 [Ceratodon purpureus]
MNQFLRMTPPKELRTVERITPDQQKLDLQKGLGIDRSTATNAGLRNQSRVITPSIGPFQVERRREKLPLQGRLA